MRSRWWWGLALVVAAHGALAAQKLAAQEPEDALPEDAARAQELRQRIEDRFLARAKDQLGLTEEQTARLRATATTYGGRRRELAAHERELRSALAGQLRPGVAANQDSVSHLTDALMDVRSAYVRTSQDESREMAKFLTPVQRSQLLVMRERLLRRIQEVRARRMQERPLVGPRGGGRVRDRVGP